MKRKSEDEDAEVEVGASERKSPRISNDEDIEKMLRWLRRAHYRVCPGARTHRDSTPPPLALPSPSPTRRSSQMAPQRVAALACSPCQGPATPSSVRPPHPHLHHRRRRRRRDRRCCCRCCCRCCHPLEVRALHCARAARAPHRRWHHRSHRYYYHLRRRQAGQNRAARPLSLPLLPRRYGHG